MISQMENLGSCEEVATGARRGAPRRKLQPKIVVMGCNFCEVITTEAISAIQATGKLRIVKD